jgi:DNA topoisomerase-2
MAQQPTVMGCDGVHKLFKLSTTLMTTNMHLFDANDKLKKYSSIPDIIDDYYVKRLELYSVRKEHMIYAITRDLLLLSNKSRYIQEVLDGTIDLRKMKREDVIHMFSKKGYNKIDNVDTDYKYLTKMPMDSVTEENVSKLLKEHRKKEKELETIQNTTPEEMWLTELTTLEEEYVQFKEEKLRMNDNTSKSVQKTKKKSNKKNLPKLELELELELDELDQLDQLDN